MYIMAGIILIASLIVLALVIWLIWYIAKQFEEAAQKKGYTQKKYFWICFFLGAIGYLLVIALPDRGNTQQAASDELPDL